MVKEFTTRVYLKSRIIIYQVPDVLSSPLKKKTDLAAINVKSGNESLN
jgi:hypothetical protein